MNGSESGAASAVNFERNEESVPDLTGKVHQLPCCIKYSGPTSVSQYFRPKSTGVEIDGLNVEEASFRGRSLQGAVVSLPEGYSGFVLGKKNSAENVKTQEKTNTWGTKAKFRNMTIWNHDSLPSHDDAFMRAFHWFAVAKAIDPGDVLLVKCRGFMIST